MASESGSIWDRLARPFRSDEVKTRPQGGRKLPFVTARTVMNRLDEVIGPENWWDSYLPIGDAVLCTLTIRLPDGREISKQDAGGKAGMPDSGDDEKSGVSDAFKRAAVKFGVGRYLYGDGTPRHQIDDSTTQRAEPRPDPAPATPRPTAPARPLSAEEKRLRDEFPERCPVVTGKELYGFLRDHKLTDAAAQLEGYPPKIVHWSNAEVADAWPAIRAAGLGK